TAISEYVTIVAWLGRKTAGENNILNAAESLAQRRRLTSTVSHLILTIIMKKPLTAPGTSARCLPGVRSKITPVRAVGGEARRVRPMWWPGDPVGLWVTKMPVRCAVIGIVPAGATDVRT